MDDVVNRFAKELAGAIAAAVAQSSKVEACRAKARDAGFDMKVTLEAVVGFVDRTSGDDGTDVTAGARASKALLDLTPNDRRFLKSLRIGVDQTKEWVE